MKWLSLVQFFLTLSPEMIDLIKAVVAAVNAAPPDHKEGVIKAVAAAAEKHA